MLSDQGSHTETHGDYDSNTIDQTRDPIEGVVVWCRKQDGHFEVGMRFGDDRTAFRVRMVEQVCRIEQYRKNALEQEGRVLSAEEAAHEWVARYAKDFPVHASISR